MAELRKSLSLSFKLKTRSLPTACCPSGPFFPTAKAPIEELTPRSRLRRRTPKCGGSSSSSDGRFRAAIRPMLFLPILARYFSASIRIANATTVEEIHRRKELLAFEEEGAFLFGRKSSNLVRFIWFSSASIWAKSGLKVVSKVRLEAMLYFRSSPKSLDQPSVDRLPTLP